MELSVRGGTEEETAKCNRMRFVVADEESKRHLVVFNDNVPYNHSYFVPPGTKLVGGGKIDIDGRFFNIHWDSRSCREKYRYDRPADDTEAQQVLAEVKDTVQDWIQRTLNK